MKKRVLVVHPFVNPSGGGNAVAAWALEALREEFEVSLAALGPVDTDAVNRSFGTTLRERDFELHLAGEPYQTMLRWMPTPGALLHISAVMRFAQDVDRRGKFDVLLSTQNEIDFGRRGLQYIHFPWCYLPRPEPEIRWYHEIPGMLWSYRRLCQSFARASNEGLRRNLSLANSNFVREKVREVHGTDSMVLYPPVPGTFPETPWDQRRRGFVGVGRISKIKRWDMAAEIVEGVRRQGHDVTLTIIGHSDDPKTFGKLQALAAKRPWFRMLTNLNREELAAEVSSHRYGIHAMEEEHFGIAPAELQRAGCITFVHNSGGPMEIVADSRLRFDGVADAVVKIGKVLGDAGLECEVRGEIERRREVFSAERFCETLREVVRNFNG